MRCSRSGDFGKTLNLQAAESQSSVTHAGSGRCLPSLHLHLGGVNEPLRQKHRDGTCWADAMRGARHAQARHNNVIPVSSSEKPSLTDAVLRLVGGLRWAPTSCPATRFCHSPRRSPPSGPRCLPSLETELLEDQTGSFSLDRWPQSQHTSWHLGGQSLGRQRSNEQMNE